MSPTLGRWLQVDPIGFASSESLLYRAYSNNSLTNNDASGLLVRVYWLEGGRAPTDKTGGLEVYIINRLVKDFPKVKFTGDFVGVGLDKRNFGKRMRGRIHEAQKDCPGDLNALISHSWGVHSTLQLAMTKPEFGKPAPRVHINKIYTIDPIIGNPLFDKKEELPPLPNQKMGPFTLPFTIGFDEWVNWYQREDTKTLQNIKV